jgi:cytidyltransferase-like protein
MTSQPTVRVMADGCFDPLHEGHAAYLAAARALGTTLIVNVASDDEIWRKRPAVGPFLPQASRIALLRALKPVDEVTVLDTSEALRTLAPDVYAKGSDWEGKLPPEEVAICEALGIQVRFLDTVLSSSTDLLAALLERGWKVRAHRSSDFWLDIGRREDYELALDRFDDVRDQLLPP